MKKFEIYNSENGSIVQVINSTTKTLQKKLEKILGPGFFDSTPIIDPDSQNYFASFETDFDSTFFHIYLIPQ